MQPVDMQLTNQAERFAYIHIMHEVAQQCMHCSAYNMQQCGKATRVVCMLFKHPVQHVHALPVLQLRLQAVKGTDHAFQVHSATLALTEC